MKVKFNQFEKVAGVFVLVAIVGALSSAVGVAIKRGWFEKRYTLVTVFETADGLRNGTQVQMAGLKAGAVSEIELLPDNRVEVTFDITQRFFHRIRTDSTVRIVRPFIIGEKVLDVTVGSDSEKMVDEGDRLNSEPTMDLMDLMSGKRLGPLMHDLTQVLKNLKILADAFVDEQRAHDLVEIYDNVKPLMQNLDSMAREVHWLTRNLNKRDRLVNLVSQLQDTTTEMNKILPEFSGEAGPMAENLARLTENFADLTSELRGFLPAMKEMAPEMPRVGKRAIEALDETVVTLKALQKSFLLKGAAEKVRREEDAQRVPAQEGNP